MRGGVIYCVSTICTAILYYITKRCALNVDVILYINPFSISAAAGLLIWFVNLRIPTSRTINWIASSAFAVLLFHHDPHIAVPVYKTYIQYLFDTYSGLTLTGIILLSLIAIFTAAVILDQPRKLLWQLLCKFKIRIPRMIAEKK